MFISFFISRQMVLHHSLRPQLPVAAVAEEVVVAAAVMDHLLVRVHHGPLHCDPVRGPDHLFHLDDCHRNRRHRHCCTQGIEQSSGVVVGDSDTLGGGVEDDVGGNA